LGDDIDLGDVACRTRSHVQDTCNRQMAVAGPVALYAGWLTAASFVSLGMLGAGYGIVTGEVGWAWAALSGALIFGAAVQIRLKRAPEYGAALVWALIAVAVKNWGVEPAIAAFAIAGAGIMAALALRAMRG
jgi:hypothetical protein